MAAYTYFVKLIRDEHRKKHPEEHFDFAEFSAKCAEKWKSMKPEERKRFEELASEENDKKLPGRKKRTRKRQKKAPGQPKRAWSAFFYFCDDRRPKVRKEHSEWRVAEVARELGRLWEACSDRDRYEKMATLDKERYEKEMEQFRAGNFIAGETKRPKMSDSNHEEDEEDGDDDEEEVNNGQQPNESAEKLGESSSVNANKSSEHCVS